MATRVIVADQVVGDTRRRDRAEEARVDDALEALRAVGMRCDRVDVLRAVSGPDYINDWSLPTRAGPR